MKKIVIIGSGPGGYYAALKLGKAGLDVTLVDKEYIGGTCLNIGCIPTKTLLDHLSLFEHFKSAREKKLFFCEDLSINQQGLKTFQSEVISQLKYGLEKLFKNNKINFILGEARFIGNKKILVSTKEKDIELTSDEIIIDRLSKRKVCKKCGFIYHLVYIKPKKEGICDKCGSELYQRADDKPKAIKERLKVYRKETEPLIDYYRNKRILADADGSGTPEDESKAVFEAIS